MSEHKFLTHLWEVSIASVCSTCFRLFLFSLYPLFFAEVNDMLTYLRQGVLPSSPRVTETSDTRDYESEAGQPSTSAFQADVQFYEIVGAEEMGRFFVTGAPDAFGKPSRFYRRVSRKNVSVLTPDPHEIFRIFQGSKHFTRDQRLPLETPGWRVLD